MSPMDGLTSYLQPLQQGLEGTWQTLRQVPNNLRMLATDPQAYGHMLSQRLQQYQQAVEAMGDPTQPPQTPAQAQARRYVDQMALNFNPGAVGMLAGPAAATADLGELARAHVLHGEGALPQDIWRQTGWALPQHTPDAQPRFEIPDAAAQVDAPALRGLSLTDTVPLGQVFQHPELLQAYPQLSKIQVGQLPAQTDAMGQFSPRTGTMRLKTGQNPDALRSTVLHELQHAVQGIEATSPGGAPSMFEPMHLDDLRRIQQLNDQLGQLPPESQEASALRSERDEIFADTATPVEEHAARVNRMLKQHQQEAQTYVEHANRGHPEAQRYVDEATRRYMASLDPETARVYAKIHSLRSLQETGTARMLAEENPAYQKAFKAWQKAQQRLSPLEQYKRLGGEAEARMTEYRSQLRPDTLRQLYPYDPQIFQGMTGVPLAELIHLPGSRNALGSYLRAAR